MPETQETWVHSLGREDSLEEEMTTHLSLLAWKIPWTEELGGILSMRSQRVRHNLVTGTHMYPLEKCLFRFHLFIFVFITLGGRSKKKIFCDLYQRVFLPIFSCKNFKVFGLIFRSLIHF